MQKILFILGQLTDVDVEWLIQSGVRRKFPRHTHLIEEGQPNDHFFILLDGHVSVSVDGKGEVDVLGSGEVLGEMSLVDSRPPSATVTALEDCYALTLSHEELRRHVEENHDFGMRFYRALATFLSQRLRGEHAAEFNDEVGLLTDREQEGELDGYVLDTVQMAGARFDRLLKKMMSARLEGRGLEEG